jgi:thymidylate synthase (FAD)
MDDQELLNLRRTRYEEAIRTSFTQYQELLKMGVAPENARMVLPIGTKVNMVFSVNARMLMHVGDMRASGEAQWEIRKMTEEVLDKAEEWCPHTFRYYNEEMKNRKNRLAP